jgi:predicted RND superfamily exporter protein
MDLPNKDMILVTGIAAGFIGLQSYWVFRGWRKNHGSTVLLGIIGIVITLSLAWGYMAFM